MKQINSQVFKCPLRINQENILKVKGELMNMSNQNYDLFNAPFQEYFTTQNGMHREIILLKPFYHQNTEISI